jgi:diguanylate cyclase (GGDEF)-like protein
MEIWVTGLPATVALSAVVVIAYVFGRRSAKVGRDDASEPRREMRRAKAVIREMEVVCQDVRRDLATHHASVVDFKQRIAELNDSPDEETFLQLCKEAERLLKPTVRLANQIAKAYDGIRRQTNHLLTFTKVRTDPLTGLGNRQALEEALDKMLAMLTRYGTQFSLAIFDVDQLKSINDEHGHACGDRILQSIARTLEDHVRDADTVVRYGGEEFVVLLPETDVHGACGFAQRVGRAVERAAGVPVTITTGVAQAVDGDTSRTLLSRADSALYCAKSAGRNRVFRHTGTLIEPAVEWGQVGDDDGAGTGEAEQAAATAGGVVFDTAAGPDAAGVACSA